MFFVCLYLLCVVLSLHRCMLLLRPECDFMTTTLRATRTQRWSYSVGRKVVIVFAWLEEEVGESEGMRLLLGEGGCVLNPGEEWGRRAVYSTLVKSARGSRSSSRSSGRCVGRTICDHHCQRSSSNLSSASVVTRCCLARYGLCCYSVCLSGHQELTKHPDRSSPSIISLSQSLYLSLSLSISLSIYICIFSLSLYLFIDRAIYPSISLCSISFSLYLSISLHLYRPIDTGDENHPQQQHRSGGSGPRTGRAGESDRLGERRKTEARQCAPHVGAAGDPRGTVCVCFVCFAFVYFCSCECELCDAWCFYVSAMFGICCIVAPVPPSASSHTRTHSLSHTNRGFLWRTVM